MSKYIKGNKVVVEIEKAFSNNNSRGYCVVLGHIYSEISIDGKTEPLTSYTEPLEAKIRRQAAEITKLLEENAKLKEENEKISVKIDAYELYGDQHEEEYNQAFSQGAEVAWELARKIASTAGGLSSSELVEIFNAFLPRDILSENTYPEAAAKVEAWKKAKEEIKVGDVVKAVKTECDEIVEFCVTEIDDEGFIYGVGAKGQIFSGRPKHLWHKTGRHIDIDSLLKQIGEE